MQVNEIFKSIQGEGPNFGKPAIFLRTAQCNLKCTWCDTKYTWDWKNYDFSKEVKEMTLDEVTFLSSYFSKILFSDIFPIC